jgi:hypothetical protein
MRFTSGAITPAADHAAPDTSWASRTSQLTVASFTSRMAISLRQRPMRGEAVSRVLERERDRSAIGSPDELRRASEDELAKQCDEIGAVVERMLCLHREVRQSMLGKQLLFAVCNRPATDAQRTSRRYCSAACRQHAYRQRIKGYGKTSRRIPGTSRCGGRDPRTTRNQPPQAFRKNFLPCAEGCVVF